MALGLNLYPRGEVYWWRTRFAGPDQVSRECALSLHVYEPERARQLGLRLNLEASRVRRHLQTRTMAFEEIKTALEDYIKANPVEPFNFEFSEEAIVGLNRAERAYELRQNPYLETSGLRTDPTPEQLAAAATSISDAALHQASKEARLYVQFDAEGRALGLDAEISGDAIMACVYRTIAYRGASARLTVEDREKLARAGRSQAEINAIHRLLVDAAVRETKVSWALGPELDEIQDALANAGTSRQCAHQAPPQIARFGMSHYSHSTHCEKFTMRAPARVSRNLDF